MILVTGAGGFVGSHLLYALVFSGEKVRALKRTQSRIPEMLLPFNHLIEWVEGDMNDIFSLEDALRDIDRVYHCAAKVSFDPKDKKELWKVNVDGTANLVNLCLDHPIKKFVYISSIAAIGEAKQGKKTDETCRWVFNKKQSDYSITKHEAEREVWRGITEGLNAVIINPSVILGYDSLGRGSMQFFEHIQKGMPFYTKGVTGFVDINDVVNTMILLMNSDIHSERFIVSSEDLSFQELFTKIARALHLKAPFIYGSPVFLSAAVKVNAFFALFSNKPASLSIYTARNANKKHCYSNYKLVNAISISFTPIGESIRQIVRQINVNVNRTT